MSVPRFRATKENAAPVTQSVLDALRVMDLLASKPASLTHAEICELLPGLSPSKIYNCLATLAAAGWAEKTDTRYGASIQLIAVSINYHKQLLARCQTITADIRRIEKLTEEHTHVDL